MIAPVLDCLPESTSIEIAQQVVECLADDAPLPCDLPTGDPSWNDHYVRAIRKYKEQFRGSPDLKRLLPIVAERLYGRDIHWALELIQNAEDAGASQIVFVFEDDAVHVMNNGAAFTAEDVWAICSAGHSAKKNKIGFYGIGFKSVYKLTDVPQIRSGVYALQLEEKIYPSSLLVGTRRRMRDARFSLPLNKEGRQLISRVIADLTRPDFMQLLLTLDSLKRIRIIDKVSGRNGQFYGSWPLLVI